MRRRAAWRFALLAAAALAAPPLAAQQRAAPGGTEAAEQRVWLQVEALPTLARAQERVAAYAATFPDVQGYYLGSGWYGIVLGPLPRAEALALRTRLLSEGRIPRDAFLADGAAFRQRFWPLAAATEALTADRPADATEVAAAAAEPGSPAAVPVQAPALPAEETPEEARASEAALSQAERELIQVALRWAGLYEGAIDGAFGRGTRAAMEAWQRSRGARPTGILTARERAELLAAYNAPLEGLGVETVRDEAAGIEIALPRAILSPEPVREPPFVRHDARDGSGVRVVLISQDGDEGRLGGLYEIMQTLEIVPPEGPRRRTADAFVIEGADESIRSTTYAWLVDGEIKGFSLVWPAADEERRARLLDVMRASFRRLPGTLDPSLPATEEQGVDLVSGLQVRRPRATASGFFVDRQGRVVTSAAAVEDCAEVTVDGGFAASVAAREGALAVLAPVEPLAPRAVAAFQTAVPRLASEIAVAGYPYGAALAQPALTFGRLADLRGLDGEEDVKRLDLAAQAGDAGGPVLDAGGAVLGMLLPRAGGGTRALPASVAYALEAEAIVAALGRVGVQAQTTEGLVPVGPERLTREAAGFTVLVSCW
ncbi:trypsin-like peptidase domain-containing protein [Rubellimicrobium sp. CFH 75288]|uniref:trypsin-like peptidase domain-containing protein n=1 Tax=Rubellimicrobium sp. CFH 75288 TaxID=2697034 RepID=UPI0014125AAA|nr:trypsin-like peptidase domain-containing protein [Rubellimicrobium sp. CFH 75288]NAZ35788.1 peptidoglycan-binding protein [Rubellimicrobium sp. CFH 75288]